MDVFNCDDATCCRHNVTYFFFFCYSPFTQPFLLPRVLVCCVSVLCCVNVIALGARTRVVACLPTVWPVEPPRVRRKCMELIKNHFYFNGSQREQLRIDWKWKFLLAMCSTSPIFQLSAWQRNGRNYARTTCMTCDSMKHTLLIRETTINSIFRFRLVFFFFNFNYCDSIFMNLCVWHS